MENEINSINKIQFGVLSPEHIIKTSAAHIHVSQLYDSNNDPKTGGLFDLRMGVIDRKYKCRTCEQTHVHCPGHMGHIELAKPVYYAHFIHIVKNVLNCVCLRCGKLQVNKNHPVIKNIIENEKNNKTKFSLLKDYIKNKVCGGGITNENDINYIQGCGAVRHNKIISNDMNFIVAEYNKEEASGESSKKEKITNIITPETAIAILKRIPKEDLLAMGFHEDWCLPHWLICSVLPVVPPSVRPSVKQYNNQRTEDDLTHKYNDIIKNNNILKEKLQSSDTNEDIIKHYSGLNQFYVVTLINNNIKGMSMSMSKSGKKNLRSLEERLNGKEGRIRNNLMGKRVDFSARSVISPDPNINLEELGVPKKVAMNLTFPEIVNKFNINYLNKLVQNGNKIYPGAKSYKNVKTGRTKYLEYTKETIELNYGDIVYRHLVDGDVVLFNRQPSLHKMSMMGHRIRVMKGSTFRLNINVCKPYNADFDGDEMNLHVPATPEGETELRYLSSVKNVLISCQSSKPNITIVQDALIGNYLMTLPDKKLRKEQFFQVCMAGDGEKFKVDNILKKIQSISERLPEDVTKNEVL